MDSGRLARSVLGALCFALSARAEPTPASPACADVTASARMQAYGYAHVVTLYNRCQRAVSCEVWTDVDPAPHYQLRAKPGERVEVVTRNGSPARAVQAGKQCQFVAGDPRP